MKKFQVQCPGVIFKNEPSIYLNESFIELNERFIFQQDSRMPGRGKGGSEVFHLVQLDQLVDNGI
ncbi:MAG: hypothetical protein LBT76_06895, partial [Tannerella sp.]|nr:hypothetical protein [Tannerella sp.]